MESKVQAIFVNVVGDSYVVQEAIKQVSNLLGNMGQATAEPAAAPLSPPIVGTTGTVETQKPKRKYERRKKPNGEAGLFECQHCGEQFDDSHKKGAHVRYEHGGKNAGN